MKTLAFWIIIAFAWFCFLSFIIYGKDDMFRWFKHSTGFYKQMILKSDTGTELEIPLEYTEIKDVKKLFSQAQTLDIPSYNKKKILNAIMWEIEMMENELIRKLGKDVYLEIQEQDK